MTDNDTPLAAQLDEARALSQTMDGLERQSQRFGAALSSAMQQATTGGKGLDDVLRGLGTKLSGMALSAGMKPFENLVSGAVERLVSGAGSLFAFADGGVPGRITPFAAGGVVSSPAFFPMGGGMGLMGEAGAEAILPLKRGADGSLGVATQGGGETRIVFNVTASDAASFRRSEGQIAAMLARSVGRGQRNL